MTNEERKAIRDRNKKVRRVHEQIKSFDAFTPLPSGKGYRFNARGREPFPESVGRTSTNPELQ